LLGEGAEEELAGMLSRDPVVRMSLARTGVEVSKLLPRPREAFRKDAADTPADLRLRQQQYDEMRVLLLALVLEDRPAARDALAAQAADFAATAIEVKRTVQEALQIGEERMRKARIVANKIRAAFAREEAAREAMRKQAEADKEDLERRMTKREDARKATIAQLAQRAAKRAATMERINQQRKEAMQKEAEATRKAMEDKEAKRQAALAEAAAKAAAAAGEPGGANAIAAAAEEKSSKRMENYAVKVARVKAQLEEERKRLRQEAVEQEKRLEEKKLAKEQALAQGKAEHFKKDALRRDNAERIRREREFRHAESEAKMAKYLAKVSLIVIVFAVLCV
jgi:hypothetical protein